MAGVSALYLVRVAVANAAEVSEAPALDLGEEGEPVPSGMQPTLGHLRLPVFAQVGGGDQGGRSSLSVKYPWKKQCNVCREVERVVRCTFCEGLEEEQVVLHILG